MSCEGEGSVCLEIFDGSSVRGPTCVAEDITRCEGCAADEFCYEDETHELVKGTCKNGKCSASANGQKITRNFEKNSG